MPRWPWMLMLAGCADTKGGGADGATLRLLLESESTTAGRSLGYALEVQYGDGSTGEVAGSVRSDLEPALADDGAQLSPTVAGTHQLTGEAEVDGATLQADAALQVDPGALEALDLALAADRAAAGEAVGYTLVGADAWGNAVDVSLAVVRGDGLEVDGCCDAGVVSGTEAGPHSLGASLEGLLDSADLEIVAAQAADIALALSDESLEPGDQTEAIVTVVDGYGNPSDEAWTLSVSGGAASIDGSTITVEGEGWYTVTAALDSGADTASVGPLLVDQSGPVLVVDAPARSEWAPEGAATGSGTVSDAVAGVASVHQDGVESALDGSGVFSTALHWDFGIATVESVAVDLDGNQSRDVRSLAAGPVQALDEPDPQGLVLRLHEGEGGLGTLADGLGEIVDAETAYASVPTPLYSGSDSVCVTVLGSSVCTTYSLSFRLQSLSWSSQDLELDPQADGTLLATLRLSDVEAPYTATGKLAGSNAASTGTVSAATLEVEVDLTPAVVDGAVQVETGEVRVDLTDLDLGLASWMETVIGVIGYDLEGLVEDTLAAAIADELEAGLPGALEDALAELSFTEDIALSGASVALHAAPADLAVDDAGLTLSLGTHVEVAGPGLGLAEGALHAGWTPPTWTGAPGLVMAMSLDLLDALLHAAWDQGGLRFEAQAADLGVDASMLALFLPGVEDPWFSLSAELPAVLVPGTGAGMLDLQLGSLQLLVSEGDPAEGAVVYEVWLAALADLDLLLDGEVIAPSLGTPVVQADVTLAPPEADEADVEALLELVLPGLLETELAVIGEVPLPRISGLRWTPTSLGMDGAEGGFAAAGGDLAGE
jgi:hypothetical protein